MYHSATTWAVMQRSMYFNKVLVAQSCPTLCNPMDCSLPDSSVDRLLQARILEWVAISSSRGSSLPRDQTQVSCIAGRFFTIWATRDAQTLRKPEYLTVLRVWSYSGNFLNVSRIYVLEVQGFWVILVETTICPFCFIFREFLWKW